MSHTSRKEVREAIKRIKNWYGSCPPDVLADVLKCTVDEAKEYIEELEVPAMKEPVKAKVSRPKKAPPVEKPIEPVKHGDVAIKVLPYATAIIAIIAVTRSIIFTFSYFNRTESLFIALLMATLFGLVSIIAPSVAIYAVKNKRITISIFALLIYGIFTYMNVDIVVKELDISKSNVEAVVDDNVDKVLQARARVTDIDKQIADLDKQIEDDRAERAIVLAKSNQEGLATWEYNRHRNNIATIDSRRLEAEALKAKLLNEKTSLTSIDGYYTMVVETNRDGKRNLDYVLGFSLEVVGPVFTVFALFL